MFGLMDLGTDQYQNMNKFVISNFSVRFVIASVAKQSQKPDLDCFVFGSQ
jgi:hypothetical protein